LRVAGDLVLLQVPVGDGGGGVVEVQVSRAEAEGLEESGVVLAAADGGGRLAAASFSLTSAMDHVLPALRAVAGRLRDGAGAPDEVTVQVGLQVGGESGFYFVKGTAEASIAVSMTWRRARAGSAVGDDPE
jgi:Trypsin-co-occurring domain 1